jgi:serine/threonine protein kinase/Tfp pilus assembly protein PilF
MYCWNITMIGKTISHYRIIEELGRGGMGVVYKAEDTKLQRTVALKFLPPEMTRDPEVKARFIHEAQAASALEHNNICNIHEIDETDDGQLFIVMACYEGQTLKQKIEQGPLKIKDALELSIQIAQGLIKAHEQNIIHRDIKPANILITKDGVAKILDFGLAKLSGKTKVTVERTTLGTVAYMSPEQTRGEEVDHRTDIWSLGVIIYEMITGQPPFKGDYDQAVMYAITNESPEPMTGLRSGVPLELERIVNRALAKNPRDRYQHADDLLSELNHLKRESDSDKIPIKTTSQKEKKKIVIITASVISIVVLIVAGYLLLKPSLSEKAELITSEWENSIAVLPFADLSPDKDQEYFCDGMTEQIITNLSKINRLKVIARTSVMMYKNANKGIPEIGKELNVSHILEGSIRKHGNSIRVTAQLINAEDGSHLWADDFDRKLEHVFEVQDDVSQAIATNLIVALSPEEKEEIKTDRPSSIEAYEYYMKGKYFNQNRFYYATMSLDDFNKSEKFLKKAIELDPDYASSYAELTDLYNIYYYLKAQGEDEKKKYLDLQEKYINIAYKLDPNSAQVLSSMGWVQGAKGEIDKEYQSCKKLIEMHINKDWIHDHVGYFYRFRGHNHKAIKHFSKAIELNPLSTVNYIDRSGAFISLGELEKAESDMQKALEINPAHRIALYNYGYILIVLKKFDEAEQIISKSEQIYPEDTYNSALRAWLLAAKGEKDKALELEIGTGYRKFKLHLILKMKDESIDYLNENLEHVKENQESWYEDLIYRPEYEFLRSDPRFQDIVSKHKKIYEENLKKYGDL